VPADTPTAVPTVEPSPAETPIPSPEATPTPAEPTPAPAEPTPAGPTQYTIQDGDTISSIAEAHGISYITLLEFNGLTEEQAALLNPGDVISIPPP
jgi:LysM repeat protein